jgi:RND superfamily putative drug exporter
MEALLEKWAGIIVRWPLIIIALWIVLVAAAWHFAPSIDAVAATQNNTSSLPASAPSRQADQVYAEKFPGAGSLNNETDLVILTDPQGISSQDIALAEQIENWLTTTHPAHFVSIKGPGAQIPARYFESSDQQALRMVITWDTTNSIVLSDSMQQIYSYLSHQQVARGGFLGITGSTPITYDVDSSIFNTADGGMKIAALLGLLIILVVLGFVYRSPLAVLVPLITFGLALGLAVPLIAWAGQIFGIAVATFSLEYVAFVLLGAGTNYGVFMLSRYREEIRRRSQNDKATRHSALQQAVGHVGESIASSALTVIVAMAIMGFAQLYELRVTGPAIAIGVACLLLAGLTLLPALMALCGKALFWPAQPRPGTLTDESATQKGLWARAGRLVTGHPIIITLLTVILLAPLAISTIMIQPSFDDLKSIPASSPSVQAFNTYSAHFNDAAQLKVIFNDPGHDLRQSQYSAAFDQVAASLSQIKHVADVQSPTASQGPMAQQSFFASDGSAAMLTVSLDIDPDSIDARQAVDTIYATVASAQRGTSLSGAQVLISGQSAQVRDEAIQFGNDFTFVVILVCIAIYIILALLVRSVIAPFYLLATIALSALTAVGITNLVYNVFLGEPLFSIVPIFAFVFLVSLGEDFNILTIARIREEVKKLGNRPGIATAIAFTGGTVSSCGLVMAASFSRLATNAVVEVAELGFTVVVGIMLDTFIVRPLLVPAIVSLLGRWNWVWPGSQLFKPAIVAKPATEKGTEPAPAKDAVTGAKSATETAAEKSSTDEAEVKAEPATETAAEPMSATEIAAGPLMEVSGDGAEPELAGQPQHGD